ncbi:MAG: N-terminal methylation [Helicobacteraceae bacterium CG2_30_36_10]|nr:MAG: N-terminal methylation [Helicobacteraceae bacterium CG2_30_36_10]
MNKAFTLLELVFVIVVVGILAAIIIPNTRTNPLREAAIQLVSHIRYTQHLAMVDDKFDMNNPKWYKSRWTIVFNSDAYTNNKEAYTIFSDSPSYSGNPGTDEPAINPSNIELMLSGGFSGGPNSLDYNHPDFKGTKELNIGTKYNITDVEFNSDCQSSSSERLSFDNLGRPLIGKMSSYSQPYVNNRILENQCRISLINSEGNVTIAIEPETGYAHILD